MSELRDLTPLLKPRAVAILGATANPLRVGGRPLSSRGTGQRQGGTENQPTG